MNFGLSHQQGVSRGVYKIHNTLTDKLYVGSTERFLCRWKSHLWALRRGKHSNLHLQGSYNKYGEAVFVFSILAEAAPGDDLLEAEQRYLDKWYGPGCYNILPVAGSPRDRKHSAETRAKIAASCAGRAFSAETRAKLAEKARTRVLSPERLANRAATRIRKEMESC